MTTRQPTTDAPPPIERTPRDEGEAQDHDGRWKWTEFLIVAVLAIVITACILLVLFEHYPGG